MMRLLSLAAVATALTFAACTSGPSWDQPGRTTAMNKSGDMINANSSTVSDQDRQFVTGAAAGGTYEIESSQLALQKTQTPRVRMIAEHMIRDHTEANKQLNLIAQQKSIVTPTAPTADQQEMINKLNALSGTSFDQEYLTQQKLAHEQTISMFKRESDDGSDMPIKSFAMNTLPTLQEHYRMITNGDNTMSMDQK